MRFALSEHWKKVLKNEITSTYFKNLMEFVKNEYENQQCFPPEDLLFSAYQFCELKEIKVVILGQDPYHGVGQANGLAFSVNPGVQFPPSLKNIFLELKEDVGKEIPFDGDLSVWAKQGVFLLNSCLSVRKSEAGSHANKGWERFTDATIKAISEQNKNVVFMLWGGYAKKKMRLIDSKKHFILTSGHPSPLSANRGYWFGNKHFSKANVYLEEHRLKAINW
ncbi:MAG: uracil-DNA glycosylase [Flavobacteriaceae bacterium]|nr:uracil-DNA glycosylase [Flavobacteriaceae bacterium]